MKFSLNNQVLPATAGDTIYEAAKRAGVAIPGLCASDHLHPFGSCRLCLCEVEGQGGTACFLHHARP